VQQHWKGIGSYGTVGLEFAFSVLFGLAVGTWLDKKFETGGWLTLIWFGLGLAAGTRAIYRALKRANQEAQEHELRDQEAKKKYHDDRDR
jgi:ATP synthase protein I